MNILFVCKWNQGRSQIAEAVFKHKFPNHKCMSAGTNAVDNFQKLNECAPKVVQVLREMGINVSENMPRKLNKSMTGWADRIIVLCDKKDLPGFAKESSKEEYWKIEDPDGKDYEYHVQMRDKINNLVGNLNNSLSGEEVY